MDTGNSFRHGRLELERTRTALGRQFFARVKGGPMVIVEIVRVAWWMRLAIYAINTWMPNAKSKVVPDWIVKRGIGFEIVATV